MDLASQSRAQRRRLAEKDVEAARAALAAAASVAAAEAAKLDVMSAAEEGPLMRCLRPVFRCIPR